MKTLTIRPTTGWAPLRLDEFWEYRELLYFLAWRDFKVRYKQTFVGAAWAIIQPVATMLVFSIVFGGLAKIPSDGVPYPVFSYTALVPWTFFAGALSSASNSLVSNARLLRKVYFPRMIVPIAGVLTSLVDFALAFSVLLILMVYYGIAPDAKVLFLLPLLLLALVTALGVGLLLAAVNVKFRDVRYAVPFFVQFWLYATPIAYPSSLVPERWRLLMGLNPMAGVVEGFRWALLGTDTAPGPMIWVSATVAALLLVTGLLYFRRAEKEFADVI